MHTDSLRFRQRRLMKLLPISNRLRELLFYMRKLRDSSTTTVLSTRYATKMHDALTAIMSQSFEEEYRKMADILGEFWKTFTLKTFLK